MSSRKKKADTAGQVERGGKIALHATQTVERLQGNQPGVPACEIPSTCPVMSHHAPIPTFARIMSFAREHFAENCHVRWRKMQPKRDHVRSNPTVIVPSA